MFQDGARREPECFAKRSSDVREQNSAKNLILIIIYSNLIFLLLMLLSLSNERSGSSTPIKITMERKSTADRCTIHPARFTRKLTRL